MPRIVKSKIVKYALPRGFLLSIGGAVFVLIVVVVAISVHSAPITIGVAGGFLYLVIMLVGSFKMRARLRRKLQNDKTSNSDHSPGNSNS
jgi:uncharacterized membrane protein